MKTIGIIAIALIALTSCDASKKLYDSKKIIMCKKNIILTHIDSTGKDKDEVQYNDFLNTYKTKRIICATLTTTNETPTLKIDSKKTINQLADRINSVPSGQPLFGMKHLNVKTSTFTYVLDTLQHKFKYGTISCAFQGLSIPLKFRRKAFNNDSFPAQTEAGFSPSLAIGCKFNLNVIKNYEDLFGKKTRIYSLTPGAFVGMSTTELSKTTTRNPAIVFARKAPVFSAGFFLMFGYNNINFGYSIGVDHAMGDGKGSWIYRGKIWQGLTIGFDIIKN